MATSDVIKEVLFEDIDKLVWILEELGCHKINPSFGKKELRCALPDGDCDTSVSVRLDPQLYCYVYSRGAYDKYEINDIISFVQFIKGLNYPKSIDWLCERLGISQEVEFNYQTLGIVSQIRKEKRKANKNDDIIEHPILSNDTLNQYKETIVDDWVKEGITAEIQRKYNIRDDVRSSRWVIPIYDENNNLISLKARTYKSNYKELGLSKYIYYGKLHGNDILFGMNFNKESIREHDEIILFEGEKSVLKADAYGFDWACSVGTNGINRYLKRKILSLKIKNVVIAFDKDVSQKDVYEEARKLSRFVNVYVIIDKDNLLGGAELKNAPVDCGKEIFEKLYNNKVRVR